MTKTDMIPTSFSIYAKSIEEIMAAKDSFVVNRLMQRYQSAHDKEAFVAALIGRMIVDSARFSAQSIRGKDELPGSALVA